MSSGEVPQDRIFETIRRYTRAKKPLETCELCSAPLAREHPHLRTWEL